MSPVSSAVLQGLCGNHENAKNCCKQATREVVNEGTCIFVGYL